MTIRALGQSVSPPSLCRYFRSARSGIPGTLLFRPHFQPPRLWRGGFEYPSVLPEPLEWVESLVLGVLDARARHPQLRLAFALRLRILRGLAREWQLAG